MKLLSRKITNVATFSVAMMVATGGATASAANVALGQPTAQSTDGFGFDGSNAVNGNLDGSDITHTDTGDLAPWWEVDLEAEFGIESVLIYNRTNCCGERLYNISVEVFDMSGTSVFTSPVFNPWDGSGDVPADIGAGPIGFEFLGGTVTGQTVRVSKVGFSGSEWLSLVEVEVLATIPEPSSLVLLGFGGVAVAGAMRRRL